MIELSDKIVAIWFCQIDDESDFMACLQQERENYFTLSFRFRYYVVEGPDFEGWDDKRWYKGDFLGTKEKALAAARSTMNLVEKVGGHKADEIMASTAQEYMEALQAKPWAHMKAATKEEADEILRRADE